MADITIPNLPAATAVSATDPLPLESGGATTKATPTQVVTAALNATPVTVAQGGTGATTAAAARTALGLGTMAVVASPAPIANGGTGATTAAAARTALLPSQGGKSSAFLTTNGTDVAWVQANILGIAFYTVASDIPSGSQVDVYFADASGGSFTLTLPNAATNAGYCFTIKRTDSTVANTLTIASAGGLIEGMATSTIGTGIGVVFCSDGTNWWELSNS